MFSLPHVIQQFTQLSGICTIKIGHKLHRIASNITSFQLIITYFKLPSFYVLMNKHDEKNIYVKYVHQTQYGNIFNIYNDITTTLIRLKKI